MGRHLPSKIRAALNNGTLNQYAALCYRVEDRRTRILLITSRGTKRWILPKGWLVDGMSPAETARQEAWEEAGVEGRLIKRSLGLYTYDKYYTPEKSLPCVAMVFPVAVKRLAREYPESGQRQRKWFSPKKAAAQVQEPELARILRNFEARKLI